MEPMHDTSMEKNYSNIIASPSIALKGRIINQTNTIMGKSKPAPMPAPKGGKKAGKGGKVC